MADTHEAKFTPASGTDERTAREADLFLDSEKERNGIQPGSETIFGVYSACTRSVLFLGKRKPLRQVLLCVSNVGANEQQAMK